MTRISELAAELRPHMAAAAARVQTLRPAGNLALQPTGELILAPGSRVVAPATSMTVDLGTPSRQFRSVWAGELQVQSLVAREVLASVGGRILVGPTTALTADVGAGGTTIYCRHNNLGVGDVLFLEAHYHQEYLQVLAGPSGTGPYAYTVTRDLAGSGANAWYAGDAVFNTGQAGNGFIDIYSERGTKSAGEAGPTLVGNVRNSGRWDDWSPRWASGNLQGLYDYTEPVYGHAAGEYGGVWQAMDPGRGFRIMHGRTRTFEVTPDGLLRLGRAGENEIRVDPLSGALEFVSGGKTVASLLAQERTITGFERLGRWGGPSVEWGPVEDLQHNPLNERFGFWLRAKDNEPFLAAVSGTLEFPDDALFRVGKTAAAHWFQLKNGLFSWAGANTSLSEDGTLTAERFLGKGGTIGGWTIEGDRLSSNRCFLQAAGAVNLYGGDTNKWVLLDASQATFPVAVGHATAGSAPFRVNWWGETYVTALRALTGSTNLNGWVVEVTNTNTGAAVGAIRGVGESIGLYGYANKYGVQGEAAGATGAAGVYGYSGAYSGVYGKGSTGVLAEMAAGGDEALKLVGGRLNANGQNLEGVNRIYFGATCYLYLSGSDVYWYDGATGVKLN